MSEERSSTAAPTAAELFRAAVAARKAWIVYVQSTTGATRDPARVTGAHRESQAALDAYRAALEAEGTYSHRKMLAVDRSARMEIRRGAADREKTTKTTKRERRRHPAEPFVMSWSKRRTMKRVRFGGDVTVECPACCDQAWLGSERRFPQWRAARRWFRAHEAVCTKGGGR
jgi:hypothetical protein